MRRPCKPATPFHVDLMSLSKDFKYKRPSFAGVRHEGAYGGLRKESKAQLLCFPFGWQSIKCYAGLSKVRLCRTSVRSGPERLRWSGPLIQYDIELNPSFIYLAFIVTLIYRLARCCVFACAHLHQGKTKNNVSFLILQHHREERHFL